MKKRVFIIHGWDAEPKDNWYFWLKKELEQKGFEVFIPKMPNTEEPKIDAWVSYLAGIVNKVDSETFLVGHSIGCQTIMRFLEGQSEKVGGVLFVAGWFVLENLEDEEVEVIAKPWLETPIDLDNVRNKAARFSLLISDNDPFGGFKKNKEGFVKLGAGIKILSGREHIEGEELPEAFEEIVVFAGQK